MSRHLPILKFVIYIEAHGSRIIGGADANIGEFPWIVEVGQSRYRGRSRYTCVGSLVGPKYVITAAHCVLIPETKCFRKGYARLVKLL